MESNESAAMEMEFTDPAREDLALETLGILEKLSEDNTQYDLHVRLIELLKQSEDLEELQTARQRMHAIYPLTEAMWLDWIADVVKNTGDEDRNEKLEILYAEAQNDYYSITIWKSCVDWIMNTFQEKWDELGSDVDLKDVEPLIETTRASLMKAVRATTADVSRGHEIWNIYIDFEQEVLEVMPHNGTVLITVLLNGSDQSSAENVSRVQQLFLDRLAVLDVECEQTFNKYSTFVSKWDNNNYEKNMVEANKIYAATKTAANERDMYEQQLKESHYSLESFYQYIEYEKGSTQKFGLNNIRNLYERAISIYCTDVGLWNDYILFLLEKARVQVFLQVVTTRAVRNCPWSGILWAHHARILETGETAYDEVIATFDKALSFPPLLKSVEDLVALFQAKCDYERRRVDWEDLDEADTTDLRLAFEEALTYIEEASQGGDPYFRIERYYAFIEGKVLNNIDKARKIWEDVLLKHGRVADAWLGFIDMERSLGNTQQCISLFKRALAKQVDYPEKIMNAWMTMEHETGSVATMEEALVRINNKTRQILKKQAQQAQQAQQPMDNQQYAASYYTSKGDEASAEQAKPAPKKKKGLRRQLRNRNKKKEQSRAEKPQGEGNAEEKQSEESKTEATKPEEKKPEENHPTETPQQHQVKETNPLKRFAYDTGFGHASRPRKRRI